MNKQQLSRIAMFKYNKVKWTHKQSPAPKGRVQGQTQKCTEHLVQVTLGIIILQPNVPI